MNKSVLIVLLLIFLYFYISYGNKNEPKQKEIQNLEYIKDKGKEIIHIDELGEFPTPQLSRGFEKLSREIIKPLNNIKEFIPNNKNPKIIRDTPDNMTKERIYYPDFFRKDRLSGNDSESKEMRAFINNDEPDNSWTDTNVSEHPKFYTSDIKDELTNIGSFFDKNNQYNDKTSPNTESLTTDRCYIDKKGNKFCEDNTRLQNVPPSLITDINNCQALNTIGIYKGKKNKPKEFVSFNEEKIDNQNIGVWSYSDDRVINGSKFFNEVYPSKNTNDNKSPTLKNLIGRPHI